jgi:hypothetical protein
MHTMQAYSRKAGGRRAAVADLGKNVVEGRDYVIERQLNGRYTYRPVSRPISPDIATTRPDRRTVRGWPTKPGSAESTADKADK